MRTMPSSAQSTKSFLCKVTTMKAAIVHNIPIHYKHLLFDAPRKNTSVRGHLSLPDWI